MVDLITFDNKLSFNWPLGKVFHLDYSVSEVHNFIRQNISKIDTEFLLFWDGSFGEPNPESISAIGELPGDLWHGGLHLGLTGKPGIIDFVKPTWMLNRDPDQNIEATSWRLSLKACLIRTEVFKHLGNIRSGFKTLDAAGLEMGLRFLNQGVFLRHIPTLVPKNSNEKPVVIPFEDELRFIYYRYGPFWGRWAIIRAILNGYVSPQKAVHAYVKIFKTKLPVQNDSILVHGKGAFSSIYKKKRISVIIPTFDRYNYLRTLLSQLRKQSVRPFEIILVDQTPVGRRDKKIVTDYEDLPLKVLYLDQAGQCSSRNLGLKFARSEFILFVDDDIEVEDTFIENHIINLYRFRADSSSGVVYEVGGSLETNTKNPCLSQVFPLGNTLIRKSTLFESGLLDLAYEHGARADGDLGMRIYLSGALMVLNPEISVLHHRAPIGGLRSHGARIITYFSSRHSIFERHLPTLTEIYLSKRYFSSRQVREMLWQRIIGTFSVRGSFVRKILKILFSSFLFPHTLFVAFYRSRCASKMMELYPQIPNLSNDSKNNQNILIKSSARII